eukprot:4081442-Prymnesium_polylepis.1
MEVDGGANGAAPAPSVGALRVVVESRAVTRRLKQLLNHLPIAAHQPRQATPPPEEVGGAGGAGATDAETF